MDCRKVSNYIVSWLNDYIKEIPIKGFIVGVSGGVDSAVVASLCAQTKKQVILLNLPICQSDAEYSRAQKQIVSLEEKFSNVKGIKIDLTHTFKSFESTLPINTQNDLLAMANSRARLRMTSLYAIGQSNNLLVVGTGNKIEDFGIGFFTKYGDGGVDINPIADLLKSEVYLLAKCLEVIDEIIDAPPTDGLWGDDRIDEDQIGASYEELEFVMSFSGNESNLSTRQKEVMQIYRHLNTLNQHKLNPIPVCDLSGIK